MRTYFLLLSILLYPSCGSEGSLPKRSIQSGIPDHESIWSSPQFASMRNAGREAFRNADFAQAAAHFEAGAKAARAAGNSTAAGRFLSNLGGVRMGLGDNRGAVHALLQAREHAAAARDMVTLQSLQANLANLYIQLGDLESATSAARDGLAIPAPHRHPNLHTSVLLSFARVLARTSGIAAALPGYRQALQIAESSGDAALLGEVWDLLGFEYLRAGQPNNALDALSRAWWLRKRTHYPGIAATENKLASAFRDLGDFRQARLWMKRVFAAGGQGTNRWSLWLDQAILEERAGFPSAALAAYRRALSGLSAWRAQVPASDRLRLSVELHTHEVFEGYLRVAGRELRRNPDRLLALEMFTAIQQNRAWSLDSVASPQGASGAALYSLARRLEGDNLADSHAAGLLASLRTRILESQLINVQSPATDRLRLVQPASGEAVLTFSLGEPASWLWVWTRDKFFYTELPSRTEILRVAEDLRRAVRQDSRQQTRLGAQLFDMLTGPLRQQCLNARAWSIVADEGLFDLPFAALVTNPHRSPPTYLMEDVELRLIPNTLRPPRNSTPNPRLLTIADPIFNMADERRIRPASLVPTVSAGDNTAGLPRLAGSKHEAELVSLAWRESGYEVQGLTGGGSAEESVLDQLYRWQPGIVHIATHTVAPPAQPDRVLLALSLRPDGSPGLLTAEDIASLRLDARLVVMSACRSGVGSAPRGAGLLGLTRAWMAAGAGNVLATLWPVPDDLAEFFHTFHRNLSRQSGGGTLSVATALREAQRNSLRRGHPYNQPRYWAGFTLLARM